MERPLSPEENLNAKVEKTRREKLRVAIVDTEEALESQARDIAEEKLNENKEGLKGFKGFFKKIWRHNLFREYYRQKEIIRVKGEILDSGNLYHHETTDKTAHEEAMKNVVERFVSEYEETLHHNETRKGLDLRQEADRKMNAGIRAVIRQFATGSIDEGALIEEKNRIIADTLGLEGDSLALAIKNTDNLVEVARQAKLAVEHGASMDEIDKEIEIVKGSARVGVRTEAKYNFADKIISKLQKSFLGRIFGNEVVASAVAIGYSTTIGFAERVARSRAFAWGTLGASAVVGAGVFAAKERVRLEDERAAHSREMAKGKEIAPDSKRRQEMESSRYETKSADLLIRSLEHSVPNVKSQEDLASCVNLLAEIESRIKLSDTQNIDLITYSDFKSVEKERLDLDIARARAKVALRKMVEENKVAIPGGKPFDEFCSLALNTKSEQLVKGEAGIEKKNEIFTKMKRSKTWKAFGKGLVTGLAVGTVVQEGVAFLRDDQEGLIEDLVGADDANPKSRTLLGWFSGDEEAIRPGQNIDLSDGSHVKIPDGVEITPNPSNPGHFIFKKDGEILSDEIKFENGKLSVASETILENKGINVSAETKLISSGETGTREVKSLEYVKRRPHNFERIHRDFWYDNNTKKFDKNELRLHWGGKNGTGVDADGNFVYSIAKMKSGDSVFKGWSVDAQKAFRNGEMKMLLSLNRDTQFNVVQVDIDKNGNAIIDPNSDIAKTFFKLDDKGQLHFIGKFAEVGHNVGPGKDGIDHFRILATDTNPGEGIKTVVEKFTKPDVEFTRTTFEVTDSKDLPIDPPYFVPVLGRQPMEKTSQITRPKEKRLPQYGNEKIKKYHSDLNKYRNSPELCMKLRRKLEANKDIKTRYAYLFERLDILNAFPSIAKDNLDSLKSELELYNKRVFTKDTNKYIGIDEFVKIETWRLYHQLENIALENSKPNERPFADEFYNESPLIAGIERAEEIIVILDQPFGDAVLTIPVVTALETYLEKKGLNKKIKLVTSHPKLFSDVPLQFKRTSLVDYSAINQLNNGKEKFIINAHKEFEKYDSVGLNEAQKENPAYVISVDWQNWQREEIPHEKGKIEKLDPIPSRILRNIEVMLGEKLFENINAMDHFLEKGPSFQERSSKIREKYSLGNDKLIAITAGTSVQPKEYSPEQWAAVIDGIQKEHPDMQILFLKDPDTSRWGRYKETIEAIQKTNSKLKVVEEPIENITTVLSMVDVFVSPDTGFGHIASALGTPNVALVLGDPIRWSTADTVRVMHPTKSKDIYNSQSGSYSEAWGEEHRNKYYVETEKEKIGASDINPKDVLQGINIALSGITRKLPFKSSKDKMNNRVEDTVSTAEVLQPAEEKQEEVPNNATTETQNTPDQEKIPRPSDKRKKEQGTKKANKNNASKKVIIQNKKSGTKKRTRDKAKTDRPGDKK